MSRIGHTNISFSSEEEEFEDDKVVETGPNEIYVRFEHKLGSGAFKTVFRALDTERGIEVAWNQVVIDRFQLDKDKVLREIDFFKKIRHKHVIDFYNFWTDEKNNQVVFITELMPSGTLTDYIAKSPEIKLKIIKSWCKQILLGLNYLHTQDPPIIHRDIKCANIFINGTTEGEVKIGDLGLATFCLQKDALSVIGTPEFMAPEYYDEVYTTAVDIWAFGMAMIEMVTKQCPYAECNNVGQIFKKVSSGIRPLQLELIADSEVKQFINLCLADESERPTAAQLLEHPFFCSDGENDNDPVQILQPGHKNDKIQNSPTIPVVSVTKPIPIIPEVELTLHTDKETNFEQVQPSESCVNSFDMHVVSKENSVLNIVAKMGIESDGIEEDSKIEFTYNLIQDDASTTAAEMVRSFDLSASSHELLCASFETLVQKHISPPTSPLTNRFNRWPETINGLSELFSDPHSNENSGDSTHSEPNPIVSEPATCGTGILSDSETLTNLEFLIDSSATHLTIPPRHEVQDTTDLEDLLDTDDLGDLDELCSDDPGSANSSVYCEYDTTGNNSSSECELETSYEEEILALKARHERDMQALLRRQEIELRNAEQDLAQKKLSKLTSNRESSLSPDFARTTLALKKYYDKQTKGTHDHIGSVTSSPPLCI